MRTGSTSLVGVCLLAVLAFSDTISDTVLTVCRHLQRHLVQLPPQFTPMKEFRRTYSRRRMRPAPVLLKETPQLLLYVLSTPVCRLESRLDGAISTLYRPRPGWVIGCDKDVPRADAPQILSEGLRSEVRPIIGHQLPCTGIPPEMRLSRGT